MIHANGQSYPRPQLTLLADVEQSSEQPDVRTRNEEGLLGISLLSLNGDKGGKEGRSFNAQRADLRGRPSTDPDIRKGF